jgi:hypothetical protein
LERPEKNQPITVSSEFAVVDVALDRESKGDRLRIRDVDAERTLYLDALELECLVWIPEDELKEFISQYMDPSRHRWRDEQTSSDNDTG